MTKEFLQELKSTKQNYKEMIDFCTDGQRILNNEIISKYWSIADDMEVFVVLIMTKTNSQLKYFSITLLQKMVLKCCQSTQTKSCIICHRLICIF